MQGWIQTSRIRNDKQLRSFIDGGGRGGRGREGARAINEAVIFNPLPFVGPQRSGHHVCTRNIPYLAGNQILAQFAHTYLFGRPWQLNLAGNRILGAGGAPLSVEGDVPAWSLTAERPGSPRCAAPAAMARLLRRKPGLTRYLEEVTYSCQAGSAVGFGGRAPAAHCGSARDTLYYFDALLSPQTAVSVSQITMLKDKKDRHQTSYHAIQTNTRQIQRETGLAQEFTRICNNALFRLRSLLFAFRNNVPVCLRANVPMCIYARVRVHACVRLRVQARPVAQRSGQRGTFRICKVSCGRHARRYRLKGITVVVPAACASVVGLLARSSL